MLLRLNKCCHDASTALVGLQERVLTVARVGSSAPTSIDGGHKFLLCDPTGHIVERVRFS